MAGSPQPKKKKKLRGGGPNQGEGTGDLVTAGANSKAGQKKRFDSGGSRSELGETEKKLKRNHRLLDRIIY